MPAPPEPDDTELARLLRHSLQALPEVPAWASERALAVWRTPVTAAVAPGLLARLQAVLSFDSWQAPLAPALRSAGHVPGSAQGGELRQLLYTVGEHDIDLRVALLPPAPGADPAAAPRFQISGQVLGPEVGGSAQWLALAADGQAAAAAQAPAAAFDALGEFVLDPLPAGDGVLRLQLGPDSVDLPVLRLQPGRAGSTAAG